MSGRKVRVPQEAEAALSSEAARLWEIGKRDIESYALGLCLATPEVRKELADLASQAFYVEDDK